MTDASSKKSPRPVHLPKPGNRRLSLLLLLILCLLLAAAAIYLRRMPRQELVNRTGYTFEKGTVQKILKDNLNESGTRNGEQKVRILMCSGPLKDQEVEATSASGYLFGAPCAHGMKVIVMQSIAGDIVHTAVYAQDRGLIILGFALIYLLVICLVGGKQGLRGALGLIYTLVAFVFVYIPLLYLGYPPLLTTILLCMLTTFASLLFIGGWSKKTLIVTLGTTAGVVIAGVSAGLFSKFSGVSGWNVSNIESLMVLWNTRGIQVGQLLFSGLLISALGAVMDVSMSISSSIEEICQQRPEITQEELIQAGLRIGRDLMGTDANTLILAFVGSSASQLLLTYSYDLPALQIINANNVGILIMQGLAGSLGIVLCVPCTVLLASLIYRPQKRSS